MSLIRKCDRNGSVDPWWQHFWKATKMAELKDKVEAEMTRYRALQDGARPAAPQVQVLAAQRQTYAQQANENSMVKKVRGHWREALRIDRGLDLLDADAKVYKLVGPVLLKQDADEAKTNVDKRLEFINNELYESRAAPVPQLTSDCSQH
ncbi:hypothetical protein BBJ28_00007904 [Nothophytophthora sp. Chile5]|nr:hypothetical protein BBJ28_00007904 [Nothophytophthora sp. Chile5]